MVLEAHCGEPHPYHNNARAQIVDHRDKKGAKWLIRRRRRRRRSRSRRSRSGRGGGAAAPALFIYFICVASSPRENVKNKDSNGAF